MVSCMLAFMPLVGCSTTRPTLPSEDELVSLKTPSRKVAQAATDDDDEDFSSDVKMYMIWPVGTRRISGEFLERRKRKQHKGIDLPAPQGTKVYAPAEGVVAYVGRKFRGYGKLIVIEHTDRVATFFAHLSKIYVREGDRISQGEIIGLVGRTGRASAPHLHFEVRVNQIPVDPLDFLP